MRPVLPAPAVRYGASPLACATPMWSAIAAQRRCAPVRCSRSRRGVPIRMVMTGEQTVTVPILASHARRLADDPAGAPNPIS